MGYHCPTSNNLVLSLCLSLLPESLVLKSLNNCGSTKRVSNYCNFIPVNRVLGEKAWYKIVSIS